MLKLSGVALIGLVAVAMPFVTPLTAARATTLGPYAASCQKGGPAVIARVSGLKARTGVVRVQLYSDNKATFLEKKQYIERVDVAATRGGVMDICVPVPKAGRYAISVRHDLDGNGKTSRADGGGFSGNPSVSISDLALKRKPDMNRVAFTVSEGPRLVPVTLNYIQGLSFKPVGA